MISMRSDESYRESSELRCYSTEYDIFLTQCAVLFSLREKKVGKLIFGFTNKMKNLLERERPASSH